MSVEDRKRWDERYRSAARPIPRCPELFAPYQDLFPSSGTALDIACGSGSGSLWLARRGLSVTGIDVSQVAIAAADEAAVADDLADRCRFAVIDLDSGLPDGPPVDVVMCHRFRQPSLYRLMAERLRPGGLLAIAVLSEVGGEPGPFRAPAGELTESFSALETIVAVEGDGSAVLLARKQDEKHDDR